MAALLRKNAKWRATHKPRRLPRKLFPSPPVSVPAKFASPPASEEEASAAAPAAVADNPANRRRAAKTIAALMAARPRVAAADAVRPRNVRASYSWDGSRTTMHYPHPVRAATGYVEAREIARVLVTSDSRILPELPPSGIRTMVQCVDYHKRRAAKAIEVLIEVTAAYNMSTDGPHIRHLPRPPVQACVDDSSDSVEDI